MAWGPTPSAPGTLVTADNAAVTPGAPASIPAGSILFAFGAHRQRSTVTWADSLSWQQLLNARGMCLFAKVAVGSDTMTQLTPSGGSAGNRCGAGGFYVEGGNTTLASLLHASADQTNASADATNETPALTISINDTLVLYMGVYANNLMESAQPNSSTKILEINNGTNGGITAIVSYEIQTTAANISASAFNYIGSAALHASAVVALTVANNIIIPKVMYTKLMEGY